MTTIDARAYFRSSQAQEFMDAFQERNRSLFARSYWAWMSTAPKGCNAFPVAQRLNADRHRLAQSFGCLACASFLDKVKGHAHDHDGADDQKAGHIAGERGDRAGDEKDDDEGVFEPGEELKDERALLRRSQHVRAGLLQPFSRFAARKAGSGRVQQLQEFGN